MNENGLIGVAGGGSGFAALLATVYFGGTVSEGFVTLAFVTTIVTVGLFLIRRRIREILRIATVGSRRADR